MSAPRTPPAVTLWSVALLLLAASPLAAGYASALVLLPLVVAVLVPFALVALGRRLRVPTWATAAAVLALVLLAVTPLARQDEVVPADTVPSWRQTPAAAALGPVLDTVARLLTAPRPAPLRADLVVPVVVLAAVVALGTALALGGRSRARVAPLVGAVVLYTAAQLLTAGAADTGLVAALCVVVAAAGWTLLDGRAVEHEALAPVLGEVHRPTRVRWRTGGVVALVVVGLVGSVGLTAAAAVRGTPFEPREHVVPPRLPAAVANPLAELAGWHATPDAELLRVRGDQPGYLTWVTLPDFDGTGWTASLDLRPVGAVATPTLPPGAARRVVDVEVELVGLAGPGGPPGPWLPSAGVAVAADLPGTLVDVDTGVLALAPEADGRLPADLTYSVRGHVDAPDAPHALAAGVPGGGEAERYLALPRFPSDLRAYAQAVVADATSRFDQASMLADEVRGDRDLATDAVSGSSYARVRELLFAAPDAGGQVGTSEQFASAFAVLARSIGLPSRVVLGFTVPPAEDGGTHVVRGRDARVWAEVYLAGAGWVRFDPAPDAATATSVDRDTMQQDTGTPVGEGEDLPDDQPAVDVPGDEPVAPPQDAVRRTGTTPGAVVGVLTALVVLGVLGLAVARARRTHRLRGAGAAGAWQHVEDALRLREGPPPASASAPELARRMASLAGEDPGVARDADHLAVLAEEAAFAPHGPAGGDAADADAWQAARRVSGALRAGARPARRATWHVDPAPLRRR